MTVQAQTFRLAGLVRVAVLVAILAVVLYPLFWMIGSSFKSQTEISLADNANIIPKEFTPANYADGWGSLGETFATFFANSVLLSGLAVVGNVLSCLLAAYAFSRLRFRGRKAFFGVMIGTLLLPGHVLVIPQYVLFRTLEWTGTFAPLIVPHFLATEAFFVFLMVQFMRGIPKELDEAARIDGCGPYQTFARVILPLSKPAIVTTAIFSFIWTWNEFFRPLVYLSDTTDWTVSVALRQFIDSAGQSAVGPMFAMSVLSLIPILLFFLFFQRLLVEGINTSGIKG